MEDSEDDGRLLSYDEDTGIVVLFPAGIAMAKEIMRLFAEGMELPEIEEEVGLARFDAEPGVGARILVAAADLAGVLD